MKRSRPRNTFEEISRYRALLVHLDRDYRVLLSVFEMLHLTTEEDLQKKIHQTPRIRGFKLIADSLLSRCVIMMHRILHAGRDTNPSLCLLVRPLLERQNQRNRILEALEQHHADSPEIELIWQNPQTYIYLPKFPRTSLSLEEQKLQFWDRIARIRNDWTYLECECKIKLDDARHDFFAHLQLVEQTIENPQEEIERGLLTSSESQKVARPHQYTFSAISSPTFEELWLSVCDLIPRIGICITDVLHVWQKTTVDYNNAKRSARREAIEFWQPDS